MSCPGCAEELTSFHEEPHAPLQWCAGCNGAWMDFSDLNRLLLHSNLPGLESLGGRLSPEGSGVTCADCQLDLARIENGDRHAPRYYLTCESCGGSFVPFEDDAAPDAASARTAIVAAFRQFAAKKKNSA
jgi:hypothetical protein